MLKISVEFLPPVYVVPWEGTVFTGVCLSTGGGVQPANSAGGISGQSGGGGQVQLTGGGQSGPAGGGGSGPAGGGRSGPADRGGSGPAGGGRGLFQKDFNQRIFLKKISIN